MPLPTSNNSTSEERSTLAPAEEPHTSHNYYISHLSGGTGGAGGTGGKEGGGGGVGEGPSFQATTMNVVIQNDPAEREKVIEWVSPLNFFPRQADILKARQPGTGEWLLQESLFKDWRAGEIRALWCRGIPGPGKTVLASIAVDDLRTNPANNITGVAVLYLDHKITAETHSPTNLLAAIWQQLVVTTPISPRVSKLYQKHRAQGTSLSLQEVYSVLHSAIQEFSRVFIVVDALDEYPEEERETLLRHLWSLGPAVGLMLTSRPHINIHHVISNFKSVDVRAAEEDIRKYVEAQIEKSSRLSRHINNSSTLRELIEEKIVKRSDGMFLLARLHIESLMTKQNVAAVQDALGNLSSSLNSAYDDIVNRINQQREDDRQLAWRTLSWVLHAMRPLEPFELQDALAIQPEATSLDPDRQTDMDIILSVCAGLVVVNVADKKVRLIHYSTQTYLQSVQSTIFPHAQREITLACMTYLRLTPYNVSGESKQLDPWQALFYKYHSLLDYAVEYCLVHARGKPETEIQDQILQFLGNCSAWRKLWNCSRTGRRNQLGPNKLLIAITFGLEVISNHILRKDGPGRLLQEAVSKGNSDAVRFLLKNHVHGENESEALLEAVIHGHEQVVGLLLAHDAENNSRDGYVNKQCVKLNTKSHNHYSTALYQAVSKGTEGIVELLIKHGADVNAGGGEYGSPLHAAVWCGHEAIVQLLLRHGADMNAKTGKYGSPLQLAFTRKCSVIISILLKHGAGLDEKHRSWELIWGSSNALHAAVEMGHAGISRQLLECGADVNAQGGLYGSALQAASKQGNEVVIKLLLEYGADVNVQGGLYGSALQHASSLGHESIVRLLLEHGADVNVQGGWYGSALRAASSQGHGVVVKLLLDHGADVNGRSGLCSSALQAASSQGHEAVVKLLLERGANFDTGGLYGSALWEATIQGHEAVVKLLLEHGAPANANDWWYGSILQLASRHGHEGIVELLLDHGANVNAQGGPYGSALQAANNQGHEIIAKLLLQHGANAGAGGPGHTSAQDTYTGVTPLAKGPKRRLSRTDSDSDSDSDSESGTHKMKRGRRWTESSDLD
ncbi:putative ankyrin repeat protein [Mycena venus]|uniref:Putative ankyrin repeat protein n=1 Tax=Mycena venus TaxID=2733690 RepID=A0A8H6XSN2_9AGAR|nr:putative ankyrin repeat protein [Mycena venus]